MQGAGITSGDFAQVEAHLGIPHRIQTIAIGVIASCALLCLLGVLKARYNRKKAQIIDLSASYQEIGKQPIDVSKDSDIDRLCDDSSKIKTD